MRGLILGTAACLSSSHAACFCNGVLVLVGGDGSVCVCSACCCSVRLSLRTFSNGCLEVLSGETVTVISLRSAALFVWVAVSRSCARGGWYRVQVASVRPALLAPLDPGGSDLGCGRSSSVPGVRRATVGTRCCGDPGPSLLWLVGPGFGGVVVVWPGAQWARCEWEASGLFVN